MIHSIKPDISEYLENSTIHGLSHIAKTNRSLLRVIWIVVVSSGFSFAGYLIWQSVDNWNQNPVATTISTYPIEQVTFPKIYVCPPKHTYTNLNYDIVHTKNVSLSDEIIQELKDLVEFKIEEAEMEKIMFEIDSLYERNKYLNWYEGLTEIKLPEKNSYNGDNFQYLEFLSAKNKGVVKSMSFNQQFQRDKMLLFTNEIFYIKSNFTDLSNSKKFILELSVDLKETNGGVDKLTISHDPYGLAKTIAIFSQTGQTSQTIEFSQNVNMTKVDLTYERILLPNQIDAWKSSRMTGFMLKWYYIDEKNNTIDVPQFTYPYKDSQKNKIFKKLVDILSSSINKQLILDIVKDERVSLIRKNDKISCDYYNNLIEEDEMENIMNTLSNKISIKQNFKKQKVDEDLKLSAETFFYLFNCPDSKLGVLRTFLKNLLHTKDRVNFY